MYYNYTLYIWWDIVCTYPIIRSYTSNNAGVVYMYIYVSCMTTQYPGAAFMTTTFIFLHIHVYNLSNKGIP